MAAEAKQIDRRKTDERWSNPRHYVLLSNAPINDDLRAELTEALGKVLPNCQIHYQTGRDICASLDAQPRLRLSFPQLLGLADLQGLLRAELLADIDNRTLGAMRLAHQEARRFVPTGAYRQALSRLENDHTVVLTGPPEVGKTTIARLLGLGFLAEKWEVYECRSPQDLLRARRAEPRQLFIADDAFGSTEFRPDIADEWAAEMEGILGSLDHRHRLIWTSRSAVLRGALAEMALKGNAEHWPEPDEIEVDAGLLTEEEKALMIYRHCKAADLKKEARALVRQHARLVVSHANFTPERIARFVRRRLPAIADLPAEERASEFQRAVHEEMVQPTNNMRQAFDALGPDDQRVLIAMLDAGRSSVSIADLAAAYHRSGATRDLGERLGVLGGHFLRPMNVDETVEWMHPSWRDLIIERLSADVLRRREFLSCCGVDGLLLALSTRGGTSGDRRFPLLKDPEDWETLVGRLPNLVKESNTADTRRLLSAVAELSRRNPGALVTRLVRLALEEIRARWHSRGEALDPYSLELYYGTSERLTPLLPGPDLRATWEAVDPIGELEAADPHDFLGQHLADRISRWLRTAQVIQANEPRFFRQVEFPANSAIAVDKYIALVTYDLQSEYLTSGIDEHEVAALEMRAFEKAPAQAAALFPDHRGDLQRLAEAAGEKAVGFELAVERLADEAEERRREIEDWEHIDYDESEDAPTQHEAFSLAALMSDL